MQLLCLSQPICVFNDNAKQDSPWRRSLEMLRLQLSGRERRSFTHKNPHTHPLTGGHFHTACLLSLCNPQYPEQLRSSGCWLHTLDDTLLAFRRDSRRCSKHVRPRYRDSITFPMQHHSLASDEVDQSTEVTQSFGKSVRITKTVYSILCWTCPKNPIVSAGP